MTPASQKPAPDDPQAWKVLDSKYISKRPWLTVRQDCVQLPSGATIDEYYVLEYSEWINVLAITDDDYIVMVRQYRHPLQQVYLELPGGVVDASDVNPEAAAKRELLEETGYGGGTWEHFMSLSANPSTHTNLTHSFLARSVVKLQEHAQEHTEDLRTHLLKLEEVQRIVLNGGIIQALHAAPLLKYFLLRNTLK
ncbi:MAG TPA: NUDIX hydrolase [Tepidisphaeraceae bacterium]|nr:NUDIX hydrolase [Tepidisphaeraceae bacterium]